MGRLQAEAMFDQLGHDLEITLHWHLKHNHYPPVPSEMIEPARCAIEAAEQGDAEREIRTPYEHRHYGYLMPAWVIIEALHLDTFVTKRSEEDQS